MKEIVCIDNDFNVKRTGMLLVKSQDGEVLLHLTKDEALFMISKLNEIIFKIDKGL